jgi:hypothetical protein
LEPDQDNLATRRDTVTDSTPQKSKEEVTPLKKLSSTIEPEFFKSKEGPPIQRRTTVKPYEQV